MTYVIDQPAPKTLQEALRIAAKDLERVSKDPRYVVDMVHWHRPKDGNALTGDQYQATQSMHERVGSIDTKALLLDGIEVDAYRKPNTAVYRLDLTPLPA